MSIRERKTKDILHVFALRPLKRQSNERKLKKMQVCGFDKETVDWLNVVYYAITFDEINMTIRCKRKIWCRTGIFLIIIIGS